MHMKMADVATSQFNFVVATNALKKAKKFQLENAEQLTSALQTSIGKLATISNESKRADLIGRMLNNICSSDVRYT